MSSFLQQIKLQFVQSAISIVFNHVWGPCLLLWSLPRIDAMVGFTNRRQILSRRLSENITIVSLHLERKYLSLSEVLPRVGGKGAVCSIESLKEIIFLPCSKFRCFIMFLVKVLFKFQTWNLKLETWNQLLIWRKQGRNPGWRYLSSIDMHCKPRFVLFTSYQKRFRPFLWTVGRYPCLGGNHD